MTNSFNEYVKRATSQYPVLPFIHTAISLDFTNLIRNGKLKPSKCRVFKEPLVYLFYGRPAYRVASEERPSQLYSSLPVCFIFKPNCISVLKRTYPFDSGAFAREQTGTMQTLYKISQTIHQAMKYEVELKLKRLI